MAARFSYANFGPSLRRADPVWAFKNRPPPPRGMATGASRKGGGGGTEMGLSWVVGGPGRRRRSLSFSSPRFFQESPFRGASEESSQLTRAAATGAPGRAARPAAAPPQSCPWPSSCAALRPFPVRARMGGGGGRDATRIEKLGYRKGNRFVCFFLQLCT